MMDDSEAPLPPDGEPAPLAPDFVEADAIEEDAIAMVFRETPDGVAAFKAFVSKSHVDGISDIAMRRLYTDDTGWQWVEVRDDDIIGQLRPGPNPADPRSLVFLKREALVTTCRVDYASEVQDEAFGVDPGGGPNRRRRPPY